MKFLIALITLPLFAQPMTIYPGSPGDTGFSSPPGVATTAYSIPAALMPVSVAPPGTNVATMRYGTQFAYHLVVSSPGMYALTLYFVEPSVQAAGQRLFSVRANDQPILSDLDLYATSGYLVPTARSILMAIAGTDLYLTFTASVRNAVISAITVTSVLMIAATPVVTGLSACVGPPTCAGMLVGVVQGSATSDGAYWLIPVTSGWRPGPNAWVVVKGF